LIHCGFGEIAGRWFRVEEAGGGEFQHEHECR
jgi:hypothetical protein